MVKKFNSPVKNKAAASKPQSSRSSDDSWGNANAKGQCYQSTGLWIQWRVFNGCFFPLSRGFLVFGKSGGGTSSFRRELKANLTFFLGGGVILSTLSKGRVLGLCETNFLAKVHFRERTNISSAQNYDLETGNVPLLCETTRHSQTKENRWNKIMWKSWRSVVHVCGCRNTESFEDRCCSSQCASRDVTFGTTIVEFLRALGSQSWWVCGNILW